MRDIKEIVKLLRNRLIEYRNYKVQSNTVISGHVGSLEIALNLAEFGVYENREIYPLEQYWFKADYYIRLVFENSEWEDLADLYDEMCRAVVELDYFMKDDSSSSSKIGFKI